MLNRFKAYLKEHKLCRKNDHILLAISGGMDSMVMADLFNKEGYKVTFVHCNFSLRGIESDEDENLVRQSAEKNNIAFISKKFDTKAFADKNQLSIQLAARKLRYEWFFQLLKEGIGDKLATAHHLNDQLETILLNLSKGTGIKGIGGIPVNTGKIIRPLLFASRKEIEDYAKLNKITWREDESNISLKYQRNYIRHKVVPEMEVINPSLMQTFLRTSKRLKESKKLLIQYIKDFVGDYEHTEGDDIFYPIEMLLDKNATFIELLLEKFGINYIQAEEIYQKIAEHSSGALFITKTHQINIDRGHIIVSTFESDFNPVEISVRTTEVPGLFKISFGKKENFKISKDTKIASLDFEKLQFPLKLRRWKRGDKFVPLGMKGQKKLSDFMIDNKIPVNLKNRILVLESGEDIVWVVNQRIDDRYKVTENTKMIYQIEWFNEKSV